MADLLGSSAEAQKVFTALRGSLAMLAHGSLRTYLRAAEGALSMLLAFMRMFVRMLSRRSVWMARGPHAAAHAPRATSSRA